MSEQLVTLAVLYASLTGRISDTEAMELLSGETE